MAEFITQIEAAPQRDGARMVDTPSENEYAALRELAASGGIRVRRPRASAGEAAALRDAFEMGANTSLQFEGNIHAIVRAVLDGRKWALRRRSSRRLVVTGRIGPGATTIEMTYDSTPQHEVEAAGLPQWEPVSETTTPEPDHDLIRKQRIEDEL